MLSEEYRKRESETREAIYMVIRQYMARIEANLISNHGDSCSFREVKIGRQFLYTGCGTLFVGDKPLFRCAKTSNNCAVILESFNSTRWEKAGSTISMQSGDGVVSID